ncbi:MAG: DUF5664 domain-containing protein [Nitrospira sp.]|nr:DUF5664 domain-containing protein [Nitrospira sp.]
MDKPKFKVGDICVTDCPEFPHVHHSVVKITGEDSALHPHYIVKRAAFNTNRELVWLSSECGYFENELILLEDFLSLYAPNSYPAEVEKYAQAVGLLTNKEVPTIVGNPIAEEDIPTKPTNPKDALGIKKAPLHCVPLPPLVELGLAMLEGARKYGCHNYREMGVKASVYFDAVIRHIFAWWEGQDVDEDSGVSHVTKAIACLFVLRDAQLGGKCDDDRPIGNGINYQTINETVAKILEKYPDCKPAFRRKENAKD